MAHYTKDKYKETARQRRDSRNQGVKRTGCRLHSHLDSEKGFFMTVWKVSKGVLWNGKIFTSDAQLKKGIAQSQSGKNWIGVMVVLSAPLNATVVHTGMLNVDNNKVYIKDWNMVANPHAPNGGYFGKHISKK
ncbi:hypothetical protein PL372_09625 [Tenacibaculum dicentrarchi]|nr:hypothetical protein [Tenacibaculum dicentrarchi]